MKLDKLIQGIQILQLYYTDPTGYHTGAEHDEIFMYRTDKPVSTEDVTKLIELGWFQQDVPGDEFTVESYDPEESWSAYT